MDCDDEYEEEVSDFDEEAVVEEEEEDHGRGGGRRKHRRSALIFFDEEGMVDSDDEEEEEGEDNFVVVGGTDLREEDDGRRRRMCSRMLPHHQEDHEDLEAVARSIQECYGRRLTDYGEETTDVEQQALLPSVRDPKLWMVKCAIGHERETAVCLMQKYTDEGSQLQIRSAIALDHLKNFIYVEADKEAHVREACKGLRNIFGQKIKLVPIKEMTDVLSVESKVVDLARDTWVRMKIGTYKGDLAKVVDVDNVWQRVTVKLIPRIDLQALANKLEGREVVRKKVFVPPPRFMNVDEARELHIRVEHRHDTYGEQYDAIGGMMFKDGFLYKTVSIKSISAQNIKPAFDELEKFCKPGESGDCDVASLSSLFANRKKGHFMKGDDVIVINGELKNLKGWVEKVDEDNIHIRLRPKSKGLPKTVAVNEVNHISDNVAVTPYCDISGMGCETPMHPYMTPMRDPGATPIHDGMRTPKRHRAWNPYAPMSPPRDNWEDGSPGSWVTSPHYQVRRFSKLEMRNASDTLSDTLLSGSPPSWPYEAPTPSASWDSSSSGNYSEAGTSLNSSAYGDGDCIAANAPSPYLPSTPGDQPMTPSSASYLPGTPGGQPTTPGTNGLDMMSPVLGGKNEGPWFMPDILVNVHRAGEESSVGVIREVLPDGSCRIALGSSGNGEMITALPSNEMEVVVPRKSDKIKIMGGALRGATGKLIGVDGTDGIVKIDDTLDVKILDLVNLAKLAQP